MKLQQQLAAIAFVLAVLVIGLGAFTRLSNAGLGCPDWPGCYGQIIAPLSDAQLQAASAHFPNTTTDVQKAWIEMIHRYMAGTLGLLVLAILINALRLRIFAKSTLSLIPPFALALLIIGQSLLGMLTVTLKLHPLVVMSHLAGGFSTLCFIFYYWRKIRSDRRTPSSPQPLTQRDIALNNGLLITSKLCLAALIIQIGLGGWLSANYAAPFCQGLPACNELSHLSFSVASAFQVDASAASFEFGTLTPEARMSIHLIHRIGALITTLCLLVLISLLFAHSHKRHKKSGLLLTGLLLTQLCLGLSLIVFQFPLFIALGHNLGAAALLLGLLNTLLHLHSPINTAKNTQTSSPYNHKITGAIYD